MVLDSDIALDYFSKGFHQERKTWKFYDLMFTDLK